MRDDDRIESAICDGLEIRQRILARIFRMHPAIEHDSVAADLDVIRIGADLGAPREVNKFQLPSCSYSCSCSPAK
jgi:hypothetical protein